MTIRIDPPKEARDSVIHTKTVTISIIGGVLGFINVLGATFIIDLFPPKWHVAVNKSIQIISAFGVIYGAKLGLDADNNYLAKGTRTTPKNLNGCNEGEGLYSAMLTDEQYERFKDPIYMNYIESGKPLDQAESNSRSEFAIDDNSARTPYITTQYDREISPGIAMLDMAKDETNLNKITNGIQEIKEPDSEILPGFGA